MVSMFILRMTDIYHTINMRHASYPWVPPGTRLKINETVWALGWNICRSNDYCYYEGPKKVAEDGFQSTEEQIIFRWEATKTGQKQM